MAPVGQQVRFKISPYICPRFQNDTGSEVWGFCVFYRQVAGIGFLPCCKWRSVSAHRSLTRLIHFLLAFVCGEVKGVCHKFMTYFYSSDYAELSDTFLLYGLRTELKRKETCTASVAHGEDRLSSVRKFFSLFTALAYGRIGQFPFKIRA